MCPHPLCVKPVLGPERHQPKAATIQNRSETPVCFSQYPQRPQRSRKVPLHEGFGGKWHGAPPPQDFGSVGTSRHSPVHPPSLLPRLLGTPHKRPPISTRQTFLSDSHALGWGLSLRLRLCRRFGEAAGQGKKGCQAEPRQAARGTKHAHLGGMNDLVRWTHLPCSATESCREAV